jgi:zinc protease
MNRLFHAGRRDAGSAFAPRRLGALRAAGLAALLAAAALTSAAACGGSSKQDPTTPTAPEQPQPADPGASPTPAAPPPSVILPANNEPAITLAAWFRVGSQDDPRGKEGLAWLTAQMISQAATKAHRYDEILALLYPLAASYDISVDREMTVLSGRASTSDGPEFLKLFSEAYTQPAFDAGDFERLRTEGVAMLEKNLRYALDEELGKAILNEALFRGTPYAHTVNGTVAGLKSITVEDVKAFWQKHYAADRVVFGLAGGWTEALRAGLEGTRAQLPPAAAPAAAPALTPPAVKGRKVVLVNKPGADASISIGHLLDVKRGDADFAALYLAASWLGEHRNSSSHLYQVIREVRGLNYGDYAYVEAYPGGGFRQLPPANASRRRQAFEIWIRTLPNDNAVFALRAALRETDRLIEQGLTAEQFELKRDFLKKYVLHYTASTQDRLLWAFDDAFYQLREPHLAKLRAELDALTVDQVNAAIKKHLQTKDLVIAIATGAPDKLKAQLTGNAVTLPTYATPKPEAVMTEDKQIGAYPLNINAADVSVTPVEEMFAK